MKIDKLLSYQELDVRLGREELELRNSDECKIYFKTKKIYTETMDGIKQLDSEAEKLKNNFANDSEELERLMVDASDISVMIDKIADSVELEYHIKCLNRLYGDITKMENSLKNLLDIISDITKKTKNMIADGKRHREAYKEATDKFSAKKATFDETQAETKKTLQNIQKEIDATLFEIYRRLRESPSTKPPYVVAFSDPCCTGCGMDIDVNQINILKQNEIIECPNCGRLIFLTK